MVRRVILDHAVLRVSAAPLVFAGQQVVRVFVGLLAVPDHVVRQVSAVRQGSAGPRAAQDHVVLLVHVALRVSVVR